MIEQSTQYVTEAHRKSFQEEGYMILERVLPEDQLDLLREEVNVAIEDMHKEMDAKGTDTLGINHRGKRYFAPHRYRQTAPFVFGEIMKQVCEATLGSNAHLFLDQYVVKAAEKGMSFGWHQDSGYLENPYHDPYITCWTTLDDVTVENGTVYLLPYSHCGIHTWVRHIKDPETNDMVGYFGDDPGIPVIVPAGSIAIFSSLVFHRSGMNTTPNMRRVYLTQYSADTILGKNGKPMFHDVPFLKDGKVIYQPE